jgi:hypothetical protein
MTLRLRLEETRQGRLDLEGLARGVELMEELPALRLGKDWRPPDRDPGVLRRQLDEAEEMRGQALHRPALEEIGAPVQPSLDGPVEIEERHLQVELAGLRLDLEGADHEARERQPAERHVVEGEQSLEDGVPARVPLRADFFDDALERHLLIRVGPERRLADAPEQLAVGESATVQPHPQRERVDEEADELLRLLPRPPGDGGSDGEVGLARPSAQHHGKGGEKGHVERGSLRARQARDPLDEALVQLHLQRRARVAGMRRSRRVGRQGQRLDVTQRSFPIVELAPQLPLLEPRPLPCGPVGVLDPGFRERAVDTGGAGGVERAQLAHQHSRRPSVRRDVVHHQREHVLAGREAQQPDPQDRSASQIELTNRLGCDDPPGLGFRVGRPRKILDGERQDAWRVDDLLRSARSFHEPGPKRFVAAEDLGQCPAQRSLIQLPFETEGIGDVVGGDARLELVDEPEPLLGERQRDSPGAVQARDRAPSPAGAAAASRKDASVSTVGASKTARSGTSTPSAERSREITWVASSEWPPRSKKLSPALTRSTPSTSAQTRATSRSAGVRGATPSLPLCTAAEGAGRARRSTLPLGVRGSASSRTNVDGTIGSGSRPATKSRSAGPRVAARVARSGVLVSGRRASSPGGGRARALTAAAPPRTNATSKRFSRWEERPATPT